MIEGGEGRFTGRKKNQPKRPGGEKEKGNVWPHRIQHLSKKKKKDWENPDGALIDQGPTRKRGT